MKRMPSKTLFRPWLLAGVWLLMGLVGLTGCRADSHAVAGAAGDNVREVELDLESHIPEELRPIAHHWLILHGRYTCTALKPKCDGCPLSQWCREKGKQV